MLRRALILLMCVIILISAFSISGSAAVSVNYIAVNDSLPPELVNAFTYYGGSVYVPAWIFSSYGIGGVSYTFIDANSTAHLYRGTSQLFFEVATGKTYDGSDNLYSLPGLMVGGSIYVPLSYISAYFGGFSYSQTNTAYGTVLRISDSRAVLTDNDFIQAAEPQLRQYYNARQPAPTPTPTPTPSPSEEIDHEGTDLMLSFVGLPGDAYFELLDYSGAKACFFLTADDIRRDPDTVRRIDCEGHRIGILCGSEPMSDYEECSALIFEAARLHTLLVSADGENAELCREAAEKAGLVFCERGMDAVYTTEDNISPYTVTAILDMSEYGTSLHLSCAEGLENDAGIILGFLHQNKYNVFPPSEIRN